MGFVCRRQWLWLNRKKMRLSMQKLIRVLVLLAVCLTYFVFLASAAANDLITQWSLVAPVPQPIAYHRVALHDNMLFMVGGEVPAWTTPVASILQSKVEADGSIIQWATPIATMAISLPQPLHRHALVQAHWGVTDSIDSLYVIGGFSKGNRYAEVWRADWTTSGELQGWHEVRNYPRAIILHEVVVVNDHIYVLGGLGADDRPLKEVYSARINDIDGTLDAWQARRELPTPLYRFSSIPYTTACGRYLYIVGGFDGEQIHQEVYVTEIKVDGSLSEWKKAPPLLRALTYHQALIYRDHLVVIGGTGTDGSYNEVYSVSLKADGKLDEWRTEANLPDSISRFAAIPVMLSNRQASAVYVIGGTNGDNFRAQVYHSLPLLIGTSSLYTTISIAPSSSVIYLPIVRRCP